MSAIDNELSYRQLDNNKIINIINIINLNKLYYIHTCRCANVCRHTARVHDYNNMLNYASALRRNNSPHSTADAIVVIKIKQTTIMIMPSPSLLILKKIYYYITLLGK